MLHMLAIQLVSFFFVLIYYFYGMKKINEKKKREKAKYEAELEEIQKRKKEHRANRVVKEKIDSLEEISPENFKNIVVESEKRQRKEDNDESALENKIVLEEALKEETPHDNDKSVDDFLRKMNREMRRRENPTSSNDITEDFDSDEFLKAYQKQDGSHRNQHNHRHHHHHKQKAEETPVVLPEKKQMAKKPKRTLSQKIQSLGGIDDSSSNDLI